MADRPAVLLLDVMGTLVRDPFHDMPGFFGMTLSEMLAQKDPTAWVEFERAEIDQHEMLTRFFADRRPFDHDAFMQMVQQGYAWLPGMEELVADLARAGVPMHALSNYPVWYRLIEERLGLGRYLSRWFVSCETAVRKPDPRAYTGAAEALGFRPEHCLFVDDQARNVEGARRIAMDAILFEDATRLRSELVARGFLP